MQHYTVLSKQRSKILYKQQHTVTEQQLFEAKVRPSMQSKTTLGTIDMLQQCTVLNTSRQ